MRNLEIPDATLHTELNIIYIYHEFRSSIAHECIIHMSLKPLEFKKIFVLKI